LSNAAPLLLLHPLGKRAAQQHLLLLLPATELAQELPQPDLPPLLLYNHQPL
jgi:hypothetical protein